MVLLNISSDHISRYSIQGNKTLPFSQIEKTCGPRLHHLIHTEHPETIYVLNGPGSFTTLRVATLSLNLLQRKFHFSMKTITKPVFFQSIAHQYPTFPEQLMLFIGQKKQGWLLNTHTGEYQKDSFDSWKHTTLPLDPIQDSSFLNDGDRKERILSFTYDLENTITIQWGSQNRKIHIDYLPWQETEQLIADYLIEPTLG